jgi:cytoskeletal protein CcmA (bactofilin family)
MGKNTKDASQINGLIDRGCSVEGKLTFDGTVQINGDFRGDILSDGTLIVGPEARLAARIQIDTIIIEGNVEGTIEAKQRVELRGGATLIGDITAPSLVVVEGAVFQGRSQMLAGGAHEAHAATQHAEALPYAEGDDALMM